MKRSREELGVAIRSVPRWNHYIWGRVFLFGGPCQLVVCLMFGGRRVRFDSLSCWQRACLNLGDTFKPCHCFDRGFFFGVRDDGFEGAKSATGERFIRL